MNGFVKIGAVVGILLCGSGVVSPVEAQVTPSGGGYLFRQKYSKGMKLVYDFTVNAEVVGMPGGGKNVVKATLTQEVLDVKNKVSSVKVTSSAMTMNGKPMPGGAGAGNSAIVKYDANGKLIGGKGGDDLSASMGFTPPNRPLKIGETFSSGKNNSNPNLTAMTINYKFLGLKTVNGQQVAQFAVNSSMSGQANMTSVGTLLINMKDGFPVRSTITMNMSASMKQGAGKMQMKNVTTLVRR